MNRIYQGRVSKVQVLDAEGNLRLAPLGDSSNCPLWQHHRVFQDAINYYLLALGALASADGETSNRVILDLRSRLLESWEAFPRANSKGRHCLRDSVCPWLGLGKNATMEDAFARVLDGIEADAPVRNMALALLLSVCDGESAIQQAGRGYFPRFCWPGYQGGFDFSSEAMASVGGKDRLALVLHGEPSDKDLLHLAAEMDLSWTVKVQPGRFYEGSDATSRVREALDHLSKMVTNPGIRLATWLTEIADPAAVITEMQASVDQLPVGLKIPRNRAAAHDIIFPSIAFLVFPCQLTRHCLRQGVKEPGKQPKKKPSSTDFASLGDDPVKLARGKRGFIFRAFTALPAWSPVGLAEPAWKEFDIAAFKEALKSLNQFNQKTEDREKSRLTLEMQRSRMLGTSKAGPSLGDEEESLPVLGGDPRFDLVKALEKDLTERLMLDSTAPFKISRAALRGFRDMAEKWNQEKSPTPQKLQKVVKDYQADPKNQREVGSIPLLLALCETNYHSLWLSADETEEQRRSEENRPSDMLSAICSFHQLEADLDKARQPIRLTPAEPEASRRLYMFSDLTGRSAPKFKGTETVEVSLAYRDKGLVTERRAVLGFSAPRLKRDELTGGDTSQWVQPMTAALDLGEPPPAGVFDSALALMPDRLADGTIRHLLNFPVKLDPAWIHDALGKAGIWKNQFNGTKDNNLHLHWPGTERDATKKNRWWENPVVIKSGFTVLANDLGQRSAGAWSLLKVTCWKPQTKRPVRLVGHDGSREWFAEVIKTGMHRLPGEEVKIQKSGEWSREKYGATGRLATQEEHATAVTIANNLGIESAEKWLGIHGELSFSELNDQLLKIANRRLSRLGTYHRWSCFNPENIENPERRVKAIENLYGELDSYQDGEVLAWIPMLETADFESFRNATGRTFENLRGHLEDVLVSLANLTVPVRRKLWKWQDRHDETGYGDLGLLDFTDNTPKIRGQRGLSMMRLEQLENIRRVFLRFNRSLDRQPGVPAQFGRNDQGRESGEPCQELLDKIDRMKEQRVNQTAHIILAQALGVRLKEHGLSDVQRKDRDIHGEYEKISGRQPVDFVVIEDLSRYLSSQGRAPSENSRLMKWAHRAVRDKLKMLSEEPFGIPVIEVVPAYSSRFHAGNGQPGSRLYEFHQLDGFHRQSLERLKERTDRSERHRAAAASELLTQFEAITMANAVRASEKKTPYSLYFPKAGGPLFLAAKDGGPVQADMNAATNLGLRAIAAPECIEIHRRVRGAKDSEIYRPRMENAREKAAFSKTDVIHIQGDVSKKFSKGTTPNFFHEPDDLRQADGKPLFDRAKLNGHALVSGVALWSATNDAIFIRCVQLNRVRLKAWGIASIPQSSSIEDDNDDIPM